MTTDYSLHADFIETVQENEARDPEYNHIQEFIAVLNALESGRDPDDNPLTDEMSDKLKQVEEAIAQIKYALDEIKNDTLSAGFTEKFGDYNSPAEALLAGTDYLASSFDEAMRSINGYRDINEVDDKSLTILADQKARQLSQFIAFRHSKREPILACDPS